MSTLTKTTAELLPQSADSSSSPTVLTQKPSSLAASPSPVCIEVPVRVQGLQAGAPDEGAAELAETFAEDTQTMILLPRGAVVRLAAAVIPGQEVMLTNLNTKQHVHCKVVSVRPSETPRGYVELEFTHRNARFWGGPAAGPKAAPSNGGPLNPAARAGAEQIAAALSTTLGGGVQSSFDATIQPALPLAAVMATKLEDLPVRRVAPRETTKFANKAPITSPLSAPEPRFSPSATAPKLATQTAKRRTGGDLHTGRKWVLTGALCAAVIMALAGGVYRFQYHAASAASAPANAIPTVSQASAATNLAPQVITVRADEGGSSAQPQASSAAPTAAPAQSSKIGDAFRRAAAKLHLNLGASKIVAPSPARAPVASATEEPPAIAADESAAAGPAASTNEISTAVLSAGAAAAPVPSAAPEPKVKVAAPATPPRAVSTVSPEYPVAAKSAHIEGDVTIQADIDAAGNVTGMKVMSGPAILQTAAQEALRQWKYEPSRLDGQPVAGQILVTLRFLLR